MTITLAARELDCIRNNRTELTDVLLGRVDAIGAFLSAAKHSKLTAKLLTECHLLADKLEGGNGKGGMHIIIGE